MHESLGPIFSELDEKLRALLETVVPTNLVSLPLKLMPGSNSIYAAAIEQDKYLANTRMYLAVSAETTEENVIQRVPQLVKTCSATHIEHLVRQALPGIQLRHLTNPPSAIPVKLKYQYFALNQSGPAWEAVNRARNFAAYVPGEFGVQLDELRGVLWEFVKTTNISDIDERVSIMMAELRL